MAEAPRSKPVEYDPFVRASDRPMHLPMTEPQIEMWTAAAMSAEANCSYNQCFAFTLKGPLRVDSMREALERVVARHEALRVVIAPDSTGQTICPPFSVDLPVVDLSALDAAEFEDEVERLVREECETPFDLAEGPLLRAFVVRESSERHRFVLTVHHIVCDGWSSAVLFTDLGRFYAADCFGIPARLEPPASFREYVAELTGGAMLTAAAADEEYWAGQYEDGVPVLELPVIDRPIVKTYRSSREHLRIDEELYTALKNVGAASGATLFAMLLGAYEVLTYRVSGQSDFVVGIALAAQPKLDNPLLVAHCVSTVPLHARLDSGASFSEHVRTVRHDLAGALEHSTTTFGSLVQRLKPARDNSRTPLVSTIFTLDRVGAPFDFGDVTIDSISTPKTYSNFELALNVVDSGSDLVVECDFNADLFDAATVAGWLAQYRRLLERVVAEPTVPLGALSLLTSAERAALVGEAPIPTFVTRDATLHAGFARQVAATPEAIALSIDTASGREELSYAVLDRRAEALAVHLRALGVGANQVVGLCVERSADVVIGVLAILKAGGAYLPLDPVYPTERIAFMLQDAEAQVVLTQTALAAELSQLPVTRICLDELLPPTPAAPPAKPDTTAEDLAYVIYTSGSTGQPKGVRITHRNVLRLFAATDAWFGFGPNDVWTLFHSYAFDFSVWEIWGALLVGGRVVVVPQETSRDPAAFRALLLREQVTVLNQTPTAFRALIDADRAAPPGAFALRYVVFGGEALQLQSLKPWFDRYGDDTPRLINMYGITETTVHVTYRPITRADLQAGAGSVIGVPIPDLRVYLLDAHGQPVPIGVVGEMYVAGAGVADGYLKRPELTAQRFVPDPFQGGHMYRTGDLARRLDGGELEYLGRIDQQVKIRGFRVELGEIEAAIVAHPAVRQVAVVDREDTPGDKTLVAYLVAGTPPPTLVADLREALRTHLPEYMVPAHFLYLDALPLTSNGKLDRRALPAPEPRHTEPHEIVEPRSASEALVVAVFNEVLKCSDVGVFDNFFDLGGSSLMAARVMAKVCERARVDLPLRNLFDRPTPEQLAVAVDALSWTAIGSASAAAAGKGEREEIEL